MSPPPAAERCASSRLIHPRSTDRFKPAHGAELKRRLSRVPPDPPFFAARGLDPRTRRPPPGTPLMLPPPFNFAAMPLRRPRLFSRLPCATENMPRCLPARALTPFDLSLLLILPVITTRQRYYAQSAMRDMQRRGGAIYAPRQHRMPYPSTGNRINAAFTRHCFSFSPSHIRHLSLPRHHCHAMSLKRAKPTPAHAARISPPRAAWRARHAACCCCASAAERCYYDARAPRR